MEVVEHASVCFNSHPTVSAIEPDELYYLACNYHAILINIALCSNCQNGVCVHPNECQCDSGYTGAACDTGKVT